jgi:hypothetical protein
VTLTDDSGVPVALGVRLSAISGANSILQARLGTEDHWNIVWPHQGTVFLSGSENFWSLVREALWSAVRGRGFRLSQQAYAISPLPGLGVPVVAGATGELQGVHGRFREEYSAIAAEVPDFAGRRKLEIETTQGARAGR